MSAAMHRRHDADAFVVETTPELEKIVGEWTRLYEASPSSTPFQSPAWLLPWTRTFVHGPLRVVGVREPQEGRLVGLLPLFRHDVGGERRLRLLGAGITDYLDGIFASTGPLPQETIATAFRTLLTGHTDWDVCQLEQLGEDAALRNAPLLSASTAGTRLAVETHVGTAGALTCPRVVLAPGRALGDVLSVGQAAKLRKYRRRADRDGLLVLDVATGETDGAAAFTTFLALHDARWKSCASGEDAFADPDVRAFHTQAVPELARAGVLRIYMLRLGGRPVAALYGLVRSRTLYCYAQGFDPSAAELSPGLLLVGAVLEDAIAVGMRAVDFLRGREPYKYAWSVTDHVTVERRVRPLR